ncbi:glycosyltransferase family 4 protein [Xanthobacter autotrophicus]|uniref:glycosyltransferase family 4 protein n=1 Tax=Xanthobacter autotrophicus TaxID=280 RepID=UPI001E536D34|nr:glycosyltransferase family 4 protein [Xanthobacter autotrophicus]UDQ88167.1 glycosyltransferase family 4 protein [Xanthobacter autotrophicus]
MSACSPTKIVYAISSLANEGPTRVLLNTIRYLDRQRFTPSVVTFMKEKAESLLAEFSASDVEIFRLAEASSGKARGLLARFQVFSALLRHRGFRIVHAHCPRSLFFAVAAAPKGMKCAYTLHAYPDTQYKVIHGRLKGPLITFASNLAIRAIDAPIACSDSVAAEYREKKGRSFRAVNNGILPIDMTGMGNRAQALTGLGLDPQRRYLLFVGRLSAEKRIAEFARIFASSSAPTTDLVVVGAGPEEDSLRNLSAKNIHLMGFHKDIRPFLAACDYYVSPSATEGLANTLLETMSVGMPGLLSDIPSHRFVAEKCNGIGVQVFDPLSRESLLAGIHDLQSQVSDTVRESLRETFRTQFHAEVMTRGYEATYAEMLA